MGGNNRSSGRRKAGQTESGADIASFLNGVWESVGVTPIHLFPGLPIYYMS